MREKCKIKTKRVVTNSKLFTEKHSVGLTISKLRELHVKVLLLGKAFSEITRHDW